MRYIGSKLKLSDFVINTIRDHAGSLFDKVFAELFAGTGIISKKIKHEVAELIANDIEYYSYVLLHAQLYNNDNLDFEQYITYLNTLEPVDGFIYHNYCYGGGSGRMYFSDENGRIIDAIRLEIENLKNNGEINNSIYYFLLASLLKSADKVANTTSIYEAYLKNIKKTSAQKLILEPIKPQNSGANVYLFNEDANLLIKKIEGDILYIDPPYNQRQYGSCYHLLNTIARYDNFIPAGKTGMRDYYKSKYSQKKRAANELLELIGNAKFKYIFLSYNNEGIISIDTIKEIMQKYGKYEQACIDYHRYKSDASANRTYKASHTVEYIHVLYK